MGSVARAFGDSRSRRLLSVVLALSLGLALLIVLPPPPVAAAPCDAPVSSKIACENSKPGSPSSEWQISGAGSANLQGFATDISVNLGGTIGFKIDTSLSSFAIDIYRIGYYAGNGARKIATVANPTATNQPNCTNQGSTGLIDCGNWSQSASWTVPADAVSGIYFARLHSGSSESHITFVVRDDSSHSDLFFQTSDTTWQAYNTYGGNSLYTGSPAGRAYKVSYNRPFSTNSGAEAHDFVWNAEYPMVRFLEANGYDVSYTSGVDSDRRGNLIQNHKTFLSVGHDEYWSGTQRSNVEAARAAGVNLAFFSGNEVFWKTRWESSIAGPSTAHRTLVSYKETHDDERTDPAGGTMWTGTWRDPRFSPPADGGRPENNLTGTIFTVNCCTTDMRVSGTHKSLRFWRNTRVANLATNATTTLGDGILGYEWDESPDDAFRPAGLIHLSSDTQSVSSYIQDYGSNYAPGTATHHLALYRAASGALVFGAGTIQWAWGLDNNHTTDGPTNTADVAVRQATVNLLADMGAQPATLQSGLAAASATTDTTPPASTISAPADGATVPAGSPVTISGTASDVGGVVAGVEVSTDGGTSWRMATGTTSWSYTFTPGVNGTLTIKTRATDDSARTETPGAGRTITVGTGTPPSGDCPCTIWPATATPALAADPDATSIEVGVKFRASQAGTITGIRFYKGAGNTGTHVGSLWSANGAKLASATFTGESGSGWQQANFATPVTVTPDTTYVASYLAPNGHYSVTEGHFVTATTSGPLTALADGADGANGVYKYGASGFPTLGYASSNYWVDVVFSTSTTPDTTKPTVTARTPAPGATDVAVSIAPTATFSEAVSSATMSVAAGTTNVAGTTTYDAATRKATFTPTVPLANGTSYTVTVAGATDAAGNVMDELSWGFTTAAAPPVDTTPPTVTARTPAAGATGVATSSTVSVTFSEPVQASTVVMSLTGPSGAAVTGSRSPTSGTAQTVTFTPSAALAPSTTYTVAVSGAKDGAENTMTPVNWTFTTAAASTGSTIWADTATPGTPADPDAVAIEVGVKFRTSQAGKISGIRFYKGPGNTGTHIGSLWSRTGTRLAQVTFTGETAGGWQQATFSTPVTVAANTTYVASYQAPSGHYSVDESYFTAAVTRGPLTALRNGTDGVNGVYRYGGSAFPSSGYRSSNYWVDVVFVAN
jgi:methionine-rich copper-binding protein CopC